MLEGLLGIEKAVLEKKASQVIELEGKITVRALVHALLYPTGRGRVALDSDSRPSSFPTDSVTQLTTISPQREIYAFARHHYRQREGKTQAQIDARTAAWNEERARWSHRLQAGKDEREQMKKENESLGELMGRLQGAGIIAA